MNNKIYYLGFYSDEKGIEEQRYVALSALDKMDYIVDGIVRSGNKVNILSPSWSTVKKWGYFTGRKYYVKDNVCLNLMQTFTSPLKAFQYLQHYVALIWVFYQLLFKVSKKDILILYHSPFYANAIEITRRIKKFKLILEVEEVYSNIFKTSSKTKETEYNFIKKAHAHIFPNNSLAKLLRIDDNYIVVHGTYIVPKNINKRLDKKNIVFAGMVENIRRGAFFSAECSRYLDENYLVNILGYGKEKAVEELEMIIEEINESKGYKACVYHGSLRGQDYSNFLFNCCIAINPQIKNNEMMQYAFPSKILSYLSHNLRVVSTRLDSIENSEVGDLIYFVEDNSPVTIAMKIKNIDINHSYDSISRVKSLDEKFIMLFKDILNKVNDMA